MLLHLIRYFHLRMMGENTKIRIQKILSVPVEEMKTSTHLQCNFNALSSPGLGCTFDQSNLGQTIHVIRGQWQGSMRSLSSQ